MKKNEFMEFINKIDNDGLCDIISSLSGSVEHGTISDFWKYVDDEYDTKEEKQAFLDLYGGNEKEMYMDFAKCYANLIRDAIIEYAKRTILSESEDDPRDPMLDYVKESLEQFEIDCAWHCIGNKCPIPTELACKINDLCEEYCMDNDLPEGSWLEDYEDAEEVFRTL